MMTRVLLFLLLLSASLTQPTVQAGRTLDRLGKMTLSGEMSDGQREAILDIMEKLRDNRGGNARTVLH